MQELGQFTNVSVILGIVVGIVVGLVWAVPKLAGALKGNGTNGKSLDGASSDEKHRVRHAASIGPDPCIDCRTEVHDILHAVGEHRSEERQSKERLSAAYDHLSDVLQHLDQTMREFIVEQRAIRVTGEGMRIPRMGPGGQE